MRRFGFVVIFSVLLVSCAGSSDSSSKELTRTRALTLLKNSGKMAPVEDIPVTFAAYQLATKESWCTINAHRVTAGRVEQVLGEPGNRYFLQYWWSAQNAKLRTPLRREVAEVTGISDLPNGAGMKEVDFKWRFSDLPEFVAKYTGLTSSSREGRAAFKLYDDGWRVEEIDFQAR